MSYWKFWCVHCQSTSKQYQNHKMKKLWVLSPRTPQNSLLHHTQPRSWHHHNPCPYKRPKELILPLIPIHFTRTAALISCTSLPPLHHLHLLRLHPQLIPIRLRKNHHRPINTTLQIRRPHRQRSLQAQLSSAWQVENKPLAFICKGLCCALGVMGADVGA